MVNVDGTAGTSRPSIHLQHKHAEHPCSKVWILCRKTTLCMIWDLVSEKMCLCSVFVICLVPDYLDSFCVSFLQRSACPLVRTNERANTRQVAATPKTFSASFSSLRIRLGVLWPCDRAMLVRCSAGPESPPEVAASSIRWRHTTCADFRGD